MSAGPSIINSKVSANDLDSIFKTILHREVNNDSFKKQYDGTHSVEYWISRLISSPEFAEKFVRANRNKSPEAIAEELYTSPEDLKITTSHLKKVLIVGSCMTTGWPAVLQKVNPQTKFEHILFNNASQLPDLDDRSVSDIDAQIIQIPLRSIMPEGMYFQIGALDEEGHNRAFTHAKINLEANLNAAIQYNTKHGIPSYVLNFFTPQWNALGRNSERYHLSNPIYFIEELNRHLSQICSKNKNCFFIDYDRIISNFGKKYTQDDSIVHLNHGSFLGKIETENEGSRLHPLGNPKNFYGPSKSELVMQATYAEIVSLHRSTLQIDSIKIVIFDLDDTLWRGIPAELDSVNSDLIEGWPLGLLESASYLWKRGILLAIVSKNDEETVRKNWGKLYGSRFPIEKFAAVAANWNPKPENIRSLLQKVNLLPQNALFVDDNPVERASVKAEFPEIRTLNSPVGLWRRILLQSSELQPPKITREASNRTEMIQAQIKRESDRESSSHDEFLQSLELQIAFSRIKEPAGQLFDRCFELINKTNQFNTTGTRWTSTEINELLSSGGEIIAANVKDKYTEYGNVCVVILKKNVIEQMVMSCRVFGLGAEFATLAHIRNTLHDVEIFGKIKFTEKNKLSQKLFKEAGFAGDETSSESSWILPPNIDIELPRHISVR